MYVFTVDERDEQQATEQAGADGRAGLKVRVGALLWFLSWVPYGVLLGLSGVLFALAWGVEVAMGLIGIALAGSTFAQAVKSVGWRRAPGVVWRALITGAAA